MTLLCELVFPSGERTPSSPSLRETAPRGSATFGATSTCFAAGLGSDPSPDIQALVAFAALRPL